MWTRAGGTRAQGSDDKSMLLCHSAHSNSLLTTWEPKSLAKFRVRGGCDGGNRKEDLWDRDWVGRGVRSSWVEEVMPSFLESVCG